LRWFSTQIATCLALVAAFSFVLDGALGADHPVAATGAHYHAHSHGPAGASHHQLVDGDVVDDVDGAAAHHDGSSPVSSPDTGASCCVCTCCAAHVPPCLSAQAAPFLLLRKMAMASRHHGDGIVPDGLRRPPRPLAIA